MAKGIHHQNIIPGDAQANGFAEAFVNVLVKLIHTTVVERTDMRRMVNKYLMA